MSYLIIYAIALISIILGSLAQYLFKVGMNHVNLNDDNISIIKNVLTSLPLISGVLSYGLSLVFWLIVLSKMELSKAYPMVSLGYVFTLIISYLFLGENINLEKLIGILLIISGVIFISRA